MSGRGYGVGTKAVLRAVQVNGPMSVAELSAFTSRDIRAIRRSIDRLERLMRSWLSSRGQLLRPGLA